MSTYTLKKCSVIIPIKKFSARFRQSRTHGVESRNASSTLLSCWDAHALMEVMHVLRFVVAPQAGTSSGARFCVVVSCATGDNGLVFACLLRLYCCRRRTLQVGQWHTSLPHVPPNNIQSLPVTPMSRLHNGAARPVYSRPATRGAEVLKPSTPAPLYCPTPSNQVLWSLFGAKYKRPGFRGCVSGSCRLENKCCLFTFTFMLMFMF